MVAAARPAGYTPKNTPMAADGYVTGLEPGTLDLETEEQDMCQAWVPRARFEEMIGEGLITDDDTVAAYTLLLLHERRTLAN